MRRQIKQGLALACALTLSSLGACFTAGNLLGQPCDDDAACSDDQVCQASICIDAGEATMSESVTSSSESTTASTETSTSEASTSTETSTETGTGEETGTEETGTTGVNDEPYGDPAGGCTPVENEIELNGIVGSICAPMCSDDMDCPAPPSPATALPSCVFQYMGAGQNTNCALRCGVDNTCPEGATCTDIGVTYDVCLYLP